MKNLNRNWGYKINNKNLKEKMWFMMKIKIQINLEILKPICYTTMAIMEIKFYENNELFF